MFRVSCQKKIGRVGMEFLSYDYFFIYLYISFDYFSRNSMHGFDGEIRKKNPKITLSNQGRNIQNK